VCSGRLPALKADVPNILDYLCFGTLTYYQEIQLVPEINTQAEVFDLPYRSTIYVEGQPLRAVC